MKKLRIFLLAAALLAASALAYAQTTKHNYVLPTGCVPDAQTATQIAVAVWTPIYGAKQIAGEKPYRAKLIGEVWTVEGSVPKGYVGGVAVAEISKRDGRILRVSHGR